MTLYSPVLNLILNLVTAYHWLNIPDGTQIHNIELKIGKGGQIVRSAGTSAQLMGKDNGYAILRLPSGEMRRVRQECRATVGVVGNADHSNLVLVKLVVIVGWAFALATVVL